MTKNAGNETIKVFTILPGRGRTPNIKSPSTSVNGAVAQGASMKQQQNPNTAETPGPEAARH